MAMVEVLLKEIMMRKRKKKIIDSQIIAIEALGTLPCTYQIVLPFVVIGLESTDIDSPPLVC